MLLMPLRLLELEQLVCWRQKGLSQEKDAQQNISVGVGSIALNKFSKIVYAA